MPEPQLPIRLIALDIDGTLVGDDLVIGERTLAAVAEAIRRGIEVALVTGRMATSAVPFARALGLTGPLVAQQGALVRAMPDPGSKRPGRLLYHRPLSAALTAEVVRWCFERDLTPHFNHLEWMIVGSTEERLEEYRLFVGDRLRVIPDVVARANRPVTKVVAIGDGEHSLDVLDEGRAHFAGRAEVTLSHPRFLEFLAPGVSKGVAVRWLARRTRVPLGQCLAIGDQYNDLEMISEVGHGVAMPSAPPAVQAAARYVAPPVADEGAAQMIERLALSGWHSAARRGRRPGRARVLRDDATGRAAAVAALRAGGLVAMPTDTVYGVGVALHAPDGLARLFAAKDRPLDRAIVLLVADLEQAASIGVLTPAARVLAERFWPGGLTLVLAQAAGASLPPELTAGAATIGVRLPDHDSPRALARALGPLPVTSANLSGRPDARDAAEVLAQLGDRIDLVLDGGPARGGTPSTVVDCSSEFPRILRVGAVATAELVDALRAAGIAAAF
jgi:L-threonylcarbamoyladenylate synthase